MSVVYRQDKARVLNTYIMDRRRVTKRIQLSASLRDLSLLNHQFTQFSYDPSDLRQGRVSKYNLGIALQALGKQPVPIWH
jgi:hypothetical protein